jgi:dTDP-4-dehydrorhamnose reductase
VRRVVVIGAAGQLGSALLASLERREGLAAVGLDLVGPEELRLDVCDHAAVSARLGALSPWAVINCAAFLRVDDCEDQPELAYRVNALAVHHLARVCKELDAALMHVSTDYVFGQDGGRRTPWTEEDLPGPTGIYGASKLAGEALALAYAPRSFVVRSAGLYNLAGSVGKGTNFVETMLRVAGQNKPLKVVADQRLTPTFTPDLAEAMVQLLLTERYGLYHVTNGGECSWFEFAQEIFRRAGVQADLSATTTAAWGAKAARPAYSVLDNGKLARLGIEPPRHWSLALADYLGRR